MFRRPCWKVECSLSIELRAVRREGKTTTTEYHVYLSMDDILDAYDTSDNKTELDAPFSVDTALDRRREGSLYMPVLIIARGKKTTQLLSDV